MPTKTKIEWTDFTSNPIRFRTADGRVVWACEKVSPGCKNCYADALSQRYTQRRAGEWNAATMATLTPFLDEKELRSLLHMNSLVGKRVFIGDMTDIFGEWVSDELLDRLFAVFALRDDVTFQVLTKRADRLRKYFSDLDSLTERVGEALWEMHTDYTTNALPLNPWPMPNVWLGVSCEDQQRADERIPDLLQTPAAVHFVSAEPLIGRIDFGSLALIGQRDSYIDWLIVGGESGHGARPCDVAWVRSIVYQCQAAGVSVFVKQLGSVPVMSEDEWRSSWPTHLLKASNNKHARNGSGLVPLALGSRKGGDPAEWDQDLRVREFPQEARS